MTKKDNIRLIWDECFSDTFEWKEMFFSYVYKDDNGVLIRHDEEPVSSLLLIPYEMNYLGESVPVSYISGAATRKNYRNRGFFKRLLKESLQLSYQRGDIALALWPASRELYFLYDKYGFSTVFYIKEERYTSLHKFQPAHNYIEVTDSESGEMWHSFHELENMIPNRILHSYNDYLNILKDLKLDGGLVLGARNEETDDIEGLAFIVPTNDEVVVKELLASNRDAETALLKFAKERFPEKSFTVIKNADETVKELEARGMIRIINAFEILQRIANEDPSINQAIRITDSIVPQNNHIYLLRDGEVVIDDLWKEKPDLDIDIKILAEILFNNSKTGNLFGLPSLRPSMSLMLE